MRTFAPFISLEENAKGVLDLDVTKGCSHGTAADPRGCYGNCYAARIAAARGLAFSPVVVRRFRNKAHFYSTMTAVLRSRKKFVRIGTAGDPSEAWEWTAKIVGWLASTGKSIVVITKHWIEAPAAVFELLARSGVYLNTSTSPLDTEAQRAHRLAQFRRFRDLGGRSVLRVVTVEPNLKSVAGRELKRIQDGLLEEKPIIDNPLRGFSTTPAVASGAILLRRAAIHSGREVLVSLHDPNVYLGSCSKCPELCGINLFPSERAY